MLMRTVRLIFLSLAILFSVPGVAQTAGEPRLALVIANGDYRALDRLNATYADGDKVAAALSATGFVDASGAGSVRPRRDLNRQTLASEVAAFKAKLAAAGPSAFGVLYFSGHGAAVSDGSEVHIVPVDVTRENIAAGGTISRSAVTRTLMSSGARTLLVILDMCRNTIAGLASAPTEASLIQNTATTTPITGSIAGKGFQRIIRNQNAELRPDQGYLVAYSTSADQVAFDDGIFSKILAEEIRRPQQNIADVMKRVSDRVAVAKTSRFQKPTFDYGLQGGPPCFVSCDPATGARFYDCASCPWMRALPAGIAAVGSPVAEPGRNRDEPAQERLEIPRGFAIGVYEVTVAEWTACARDGACQKLATWAADNPNPLIPATSISYDDALAFAAWISAQSGRQYRLPNDAEWEYASRAGSTSAFPWGDSISPAEANYDHTARYRDSSTAPYRGYPEAVTGYPPNAFGLYQTQGNVWEWTSGCGDPQCHSRRLRGGSFQSTPRELRAANQFAIAPGKRRDDAGLRVVRDLDADEVGIGL